ncbi:MAG: hypothetical protein ACF8Q5_11160 [Phycisphaerales bacterium JB040]
MSDAHNAHDRALRWPLLVVGLLLLNMGICAVTIIAATTSPITVEDDYYDKAVRYDELREDARTPRDTPAETPNQPAPDARPAPVPNKQEQGNGA